MMMRRDCLRLRAGLAAHCKDPSYVRSASRKRPCATSISATPKAVAMTKTMLPIRRMAFVQPSSARRAASNRGSPNG